MAGGLDPADRARWEERLTAAYAECGCHAGGAALLLALAAVATVGIASPGAWTWRGTLVAGAICMLAAVAGKLVGIAFARLRLRRDISRVGALLRPAAPPT